MEPQTFYAYAEVTDEQSVQRWIKMVFWAETAEQAAQQFFEAVVGWGGRQVVRQIEVWESEPSRFRPEFAVKTWMSGQGGVVKS